MYEAKQLQSKHIEVAAKMADEITANFNAEEQNEILLQIRDVIKFRRQELLDETLKRVDYLRTMLERIS